MKLTDFQKRRLGKTMLTVFFALISLLYVFPVLMVVVNSFKQNTFVKTETFAMPNAETFAGVDNFVKGMTFGGYPFWKSVVFSVVITVLSTVLILLFCSMAAWYIARVDSVFCRVMYYLCVFSMVVPFQMVMFTLSKTANLLHLNTPWSIPVIYLGFGAGLAVFLFTGYMKGSPVAIEEAAMIDGCGPVGIFFRIVLPVIQPAVVSAGILEAMWIWNDYLLPYLVLDIRRFRTIPIAVQYLRGGYGSVDMGAMMAVLVLAIAPAAAVYLLCQRWIVSGVLAGAVKG